MYAHIRGNFNVQIYSSRKVFEMEGIKYSCHTYTHTRARTHARICYTQKIQVEKEEEEEAEYEPCERKLGLLIFIFIETCVKKEINKNE